MRQNEHVGQCRHPDGSGIRDVTKVMDETPCRVPAGELVIRMRGKEAETGELVNTADGECRCRELRPRTCHG